MRKKIIFITMLGMVVGSCSNNLIKKDESVGARMIASQKKKPTSSSVENLEMELGPQAPSKESDIEISDNIAFNGEAIKSFDGLVHVLNPSITIDGTTYGLEYIMDLSSRRYNEDTDSFPPYKDDAGEAVCRDIGMRYVDNKFIERKSTKSNLVYFKGEHWGIGNGTYQLTMVTCKKFSRTNVLKNTVAQPKKTGTPDRSMPGAGAQSMPKECLMTDTSDEYCNHNPEFCDRRGVMPAYCDQYHKNGENKTSGAATPISRKTGQPTTRASGEPQKDPNAQACHLRSGQRKCQELSGVCEWVYPSTGFCKAREGSKDPNAQACHLRSGQRKCEELSGVCAWNGESAGYCKAR